MLPALHFSTLLEKRRGTEYCALCCRCEAACCIGEDWQSLSEDATLLGAHAVLVASSRARKERKTLERGAKVTVVITISHAEGASIKVQ